MINTDEILKPGLELIETPDNELDTCVKWIVCKNNFENTHFSEPGLEPGLIDFRNFSKTEPKLEYMMIPTDCKNVSERMYFSEPDIELDLIDSRDFSNTDPDLIIC